MFMFIHLLKIQYYKNTTSVDIYTGTPAPNNHLTFCPTMAVKDQNPDEIEFSVLSC